MVYSDRVRQSAAIIVFLVETQRTLKGKRVLESQQEILRQSLIDECSIPAEFSEAGKLSDWLSGASGRL